MIKMEKENRKELEELGRQLARKIAKLKKNKGE